MTNSPDAAREYHRLTSYTTGFQTPDDPRKNIEWAGPMKEPRPPQFKTYEGGERLPLPRDLAALRISAVDALSGRALSGAALDAAAIARILFYSAGLARRMEHDGRTVWFRHSGSAGNLFPLELYLVTRALDGLAAGVYQYDVLEHALVALRSADHRGSVARALADDAAASAYIVITGIPWRTTWKYRDRGFRHIYWDAGTMLGQLLTLAGAQAVTTPQVRLGFVDEQLRELVGADGIDEFPIAVVALGRSERAPESPALGDVPRGLLSPDLKRFPITSLTQESGALAHAEQVRAWRAAAQRADAFAAPIPSEGSLPSSEVSLERTIRIRGSTRRFARGTAPAALLRWGLAASARPIECDFVAQGRTWIEHFVLVHDAEGIAPGTYRFLAGSLALMQPGDVRATAAELCCEQALASDGAFTVFHATDVDRVTEALGSRGYRAPLLEAGIVEGRLHLAAAALGLGASGLTFYDQETNAYFGELDAMLVTAVGKPAYRPRLGGKPGRPTHLHGLLSPIVAQ